VLFALDAQRAKSRTRRQHQPTTLINADSVSAHGLTSEFSIGNLRISDAELSALLQFADQS